LHQRGIHYGNAFALEFIGSLDIEKKPPMERTRTRDGATLGTLTVRAEDPAHHLVYRRHPQGAPIGPAILAIRKVFLEDEEDPDTVRHYRVDFGTAHMPSADAVADSLKPLYRMCPHYPGYHLHLQLPDSPVFRRGFDTFRNDYPEYMLVSVPYDFATDQQYNRFVARCTRVIDTMIHVSFVPPERVETPSPVYSPPTDPNNSVDTDDEYAAGRHKRPRRL
jgi:hypothetical protein